MTQSPDHIAALVASEARMREALEQVKQELPSGEVLNRFHGCEVTHVVFGEVHHRLAVEIPDVIDQALAPSPEISKLILDVLMAAERKKEEAIYQSRTHNVFCGCNACELWKAVNALRAAAPWLLDGRGE
jgi:hypothetical protein